MTEKVKITHEQLKALEEFKKYSNSLQYFINNRKDWNNVYAPLKDFAVDEFARLLYEPNSYEVEETFKVGDKVVDLNGTYKGVHTVICIVGQRFVRVLDISNLEFAIKNLRHATKDEIKAEKERQLWNSIGREVGEFKDGDIHILKNGYSVQISNVDHAREKYTNGYLKGFYPIESFVSFEGGE
ncbi:hypothetical protein [Psychrobacillus phage Perkons]|nr:hypothetical protein [Psychrobacillus phage Perkons]